MVHESPFCSFVLKCLCIFSLYILKNETISFEGKFNKSAWLHKNVTFSALAFFLIIVLSNAIGHPIKIEGIGFVVLLSIFGAIIIFLMYNKQSWVITNRAVYLKKRRPMLSSSIRKLLELLQLLLVDFKVSFYSQVM